MTSRSPGRPTSETHRRRIGGASTLTVSGELRCVGVVRELRWLVLLGRS